MSSKRNDRTGMKVVLILLILAMIAATAYLVMLCIHLPGQEVPPEGNDGIIQFPVFREETTEPAQAPTETTLPAPERVVSTASIGAMGDLLMHKPIFDYPQYRAECDNRDGTYDFSTLFQYLGEYTCAADYAVANLETTLGGGDFPYQGNPAFNCPDEILDSVKAAGFDMLLTANNHSYDTLMTGLNRTLEQVRGQGLDTLGTRLSEDEDRYTVVEVNGIRIGMVCYTYTLKMAGSKPNLNDNTPVEKPAQINYFDYNRLNQFYTELEEILAGMEAEGAEATMIYIHWGTEYLLEESATQNAIAQKLCDLGFDVIVGGHPHVVQPIELLESTLDPAQKTVCFYSLGNAVSNQRLGKISRIQTAHTEDGVLASVVFEKYSDGTVYLAGIDVLPTWVNMFTNGNGCNEYNILPLDYSRVADWGRMFSLSGGTLSAAEESYQRTMDILEEGLAECQNYLEQQKQLREEAYQAQALRGAA